MVGNGAGPRDAQPEEQSVASSVGHPHLGLDELLAQVQSRVRAAEVTTERFNRLLGAVLAIGGDLDLAAILRRVVDSAAQLVDARYAALGVLKHDREGVSHFISNGLTDDEVAALHDEPAGPGLLKVPLRVRDEVFAHLSLSEKLSGGGFDEADETLIVILAAGAGVAIDNARLYDETQRRARWRRASSEVSTALLSGSGLESVLELVARNAKELGDADLSVVCLPRGESLVIAAADGDDAEGYLGLRLPSEASGAGRAYAAGEAIAVSDLPPDDRGLLAREPGRWDSGLYLPLGTQERARGVLGVLRRARRGAVTHELTETLQQFADHAAVALELADRRRDAELVAVYADRDRIARDLHDLVIQRLFAIGMQLESASRFMVREEVKTRVHQAVDELDTTIREIRGTIYALQRERLDESAGSLRSRLLRVVDSATEQIGFPPAVNLGGPIDTAVQPAVAEQLLAVLREALSNVARHAKATEVGVRIEVGPDGIALEVQDNGVGMANAGRSSGLANIAHRATDLGGALEISEPETGGTQLVWRVPLPS